MDLKCRNLDCKNNDCYSCMKKGINISQKALCKDYEKCENLGKNQQQNVPETMFEKTPKLHPYRHNKTVDIVCDCKCLFNHDKKCIANGISVQDLDPKCAECVTRIKP